MVVEHGVDQPGKGAFDRVFHAQLAAARVLRQQLVHVGRIAGEPRRQRVIDSMRPFVAEAVGASHDLDLAAAPPQPIHAVEIALALRHDRQLERAVEAGSLGQQVEPPHAVVDGACHIEHRLLRDVLLHRCRVVRARPVAFEDHIAETEFVHHVLLDDGVLALDRQACRRPVVVAGFLEDRAEHAGPVVEMIVDGIPRLVRANGPREGLLDAAATRAPARAHAAQPQDLIVGPADLVAERGQLGRALAGGFVPQLGGQRVAGRDQLGQLAARRRRRLLSFGCRRVGIAVERLVSARLPVYSPGVELALQLSPRLARRL